jgi:hypothetical protein
MLVIVSWPAGPTGEGGPRGARPVTRACNRRGSSSDHAIPAYANDGLLPARPLLEAAEMTMMSNAGYRPVSDGELFVSDADCDERSVQLVVMTQTVYRSPT